MNINAKFTTNRCISMLRCNIYLHIQLQSRILIVGVTIMKIASSTPSAHLNYLLQYQSLLTISCKHYQINHCRFDTRHRYTMLYSTNKCLLCTATFANCFTGALILHEQTSEMNNNAVNFWTHILM